MTHTITIRHALNDDAIPLQHIIKACFQQYAHLGVVFAIHELPDLSHPASSLPYNPPHEIASLFVASYGHRIIASLGTHITHNTCEIKRFYVHPLFQGQKIGKKILSAILPSLSHYTLFLWSDIRFTKAHAIYAQYGFKNDGTPPRTINDLSHSQELYLVAHPHTLILPPHTSDSP